MISANRYYMSLENAMGIYTDGSSASKPRKGGIGIRLVHIDDSGQETVNDVILPGYKGATNNQMELYACIEGIKQAMAHPVFNKFNRLVIYTDSQYVVNNYTRAKYSWSKTKWCNIDGKPVDNANLWKDLLHIVRRCQKRVDIVWVKGHTNNQHNKAVDKLAKRSSKNAFNPPLDIVKVRRKISDKPVQLGCVPILKQRISIRIITERYLRVQKCTKYMYEVISESSPYYKYVDYIYSTISLKAQHCYSVRFNDNPKNPRIIKLFKELPKK